MHPIDLLAIGKLRTGPLRDLEKHYLDMLRPWSRTEITEFPEGRGDVAKALREEAQRFRSRFQPPVLPVLLTPEARPLTSEAFAEWLGRHLDRGARPAFLIGSSHGFDPDLKAEVKERLSLSPMTFPHDLSRVLLLEQIYRALQILRGGPYHK